MRSRPASPKDSDDTSCKPHGPQQPFRWRRFLIGAIVVLGVSPFVLVGALALLVYSSLHVGSDVAALRRCVLPASAAGWHKQVEISAGWLPVWLAKTGLKFARLDPEARIALRAAKSGEVVVYQRPGNDPQLDHSGILAKADLTMERRGWERAVGVVDRDDLVAVYVPTGLSSVRNVKACVLVLNRENLVVVSATADLRPLLQLIHERPEWREHLHPHHEVAASTED